MYGNNIGKYLFILSEEKREEKPVVAEIPPAPAESNMSIGKPHDLK